MNHDEIEESNKRKERQGHKREDPKDDNGTTEVPPVVTGIMHPEWQKPPHP